MKLSADSVAVMSSTNMYLGEIHFLQNLHRPPWSSQLNTGISSNHRKACPQYGHFERPEILDIPCTLLRAVALIKLPTHAPIAARNTVMKIFNTVCSFILTLSPTLFATWQTGGDVDSYVALLSFMHKFY